MGERPEGQMLTGGERSALVGVLGGQWPDLLRGLPKLSSSTALAKMLINDNDDNDVSDSNHFLSTTYVPSTKLHSLHILNYTVHCSQHLLAGDKMEILSKKLFTRETLVLSESCQGALKET